MSAAERLQSLNQQAYRQVLAALFARNTSTTETMKLMLKLRKELTISADEHKEWLNELIKARNDGKLNQVLQRGLEQASTQTRAQAAPNGWVAPQQQQAYRQTYSVDNGDGSSEDFTLEGNGGSDSDFSLGYQQQRRQGGAGTSYGRVGGGSARPGGGVRAQVDPKTLPPLIGYKVQRYWPGEGEWCEGIITDWRERDGMYCITYNLGKKDESMEFFDIKKAEAIGDAQRSYYQQTPDRIDLRRFSNTRAFQNSAVLNPDKRNRRRSTGETKSGNTRTLS